MLTFAHAFALVNTSRKEGTYQTGITWVQGSVSRNLYCNRIIAFFEFTINFDCVNSTASRNGHWAWINTICSQSKTTYSSSCLKQIFLKQISLFQHVQQHVLCIRLCEQTLNVLSSAQLCSYSSREQPLMLFTDRIFMTTELSHSSQ